MVDHPAHIRKQGQAARRRRRVLFVLVLALVVVTVVAVIGALPLWSVAIPTVLLFGFLQLARRATMAESKRPQAPRRPRKTTSVPNAGRQRIAIIDEPGAAEPVDPHAWEPVPVPLPTYLTKDRAPDDTATRTIDLTQSGAWTSGRLESAGSDTPPRVLPVSPQIDGDVEELPEHRPAVGD